jgi:hypothetical protein
MNLQIEKPSRFMGLSLIWKKNPPSLAKTIISLIADAAKVTEVLDTTPYLL